METSSFLRKYIRAIIADSFSTPDQPRYFIKFSAKKNIFTLYKRFFGLDQYDNKNEQIVIVRDLSSDPEEAKRIAKEITGQDLEAKLLGVAKPDDRGKIIMPYDQYKGKKLEEIPLAYLIQFIFNNKWMTAIKKDPYKISVYEYLTQDLRTGTEQFILNKVKGTSTPDLIAKYNEYIEDEKSIRKEKMVFAEMMIQLLKNELSERKVLSQ